MVLLSLASVEAAGVREEAEAPSARSEAASSAVVLVGVSAGVSVGVAVGLEAPEARFREWVPLPSTASRSWSNKFISEEVAEEDDWEDPEDPEDPDEACGAAEDEVSEVVARDPAEEVAKAVVSRALLVAEVSLVSGAECSPRSSVGEVCGLSDM